MRCELAWNLQGATGAWRVVQGFIADYDRSLPTQPCLLRLISMWCAAVCRRPDSRFATDQPQVHAAESVQRGCMRCWLPNMELWPSPGRSLVLESISHSPRSSNAGVFASAALLCDYGHACLDFVNCYLWRKQTSVPHTSVMKTSLIWPVLHRFRWFELARTGDLHATTQPYHSYRRSHATSSSTSEISAILSLTRSQDSRIVRKGLAAFVKLWSDLSSRNRAEDVWRQLLWVNYDAVVELARQGGPASRLLRSVSTPQVEARHVIQVQRHLWQACQPAWIPLLYSLLNKGPQESFEVVAEMRHTALRMAAAGAQLPESRPRGTASPGDGSGEGAALPGAAVAAAMRGAAADAGDALREHCLPPWTAVLPVSWQLGPPELLAFLLEQEVVLADKSWDALRVRATGGRLVYTLVHCGTPLRPLAFTSVALTARPPRRLPQLLRDDDDDLVPHDPSTARSAVFYSICTTRPGLAGLDIGRQLIHRALYAVSEEFPAVESYLTLSPIPGFLTWLRTRLAAANAAADADTSAFSESEPYRQMILERLFLSEADQEAGVSWTGALLRALEDPEALMAASGNGDALRPLLMRLCATYLLERRPLGAPRGEEQGSPGSAGGAGVGTNGGAPAEGRQRVTDPVAHFHFGNGALLQDVHWWANDDPKALQESLGIMATFQYVPADVERYLHEYRTACKTPVHSDIFEKLPRQLCTLDSS
eukprot:jgi/Ulvmu1/2858/UM145_0013.1